MPGTRFDPRLHGFHFANTVRVAGVTVTTRGRCGGMAYAVLDAGQAITQQFGKLRAFDFVRHGAPAEGMHDGWRYCTECSSLVHLSGGGQCVSGGTHDLSASGAYFVTQ
jgi:hypothetical protein